MCWLPALTSRGRWAGERADQMEDASDDGVVVGVSL
jgi:hypothetical protein